MEEQKRVVVLRPRPGWDPLELFLEVERRLGSNAVTIEERGSEHLDDRRAFVTLHLRHTDALDVIRRTLSDIDPGWHEALLLDE
jgi:hypothetical protein